MIPPPVVERPQRKFGRAITLQRLAKKRGFSAWRRSHSAAIIKAAEAIRAEAIAKLARVRPTVASDRAALKSFITKFNKLDAADHFIGTIEVEDLAEIFDSLRNLTLLANDDNDMFDDLRDF